MSHSWKPRAPQQAPSPTSEDPVDSEPRNSQMARSAWRYKGYDGTSANTRSHLARGLQETRSLIHVPPDVWLHYGPGVAGSLFLHVALVMYSVFIKEL